MTHQSLVSLLQRNDTQLVEALISTHPEQKDLFTTVRELGHAKPPATGSSEAKRALADLASSGANKVVGELDALSARLKRQMLWVRRVRVCDSLLARFPEGSLLCFHSKLPLEKSPSL